MSFMYGLSSDLWMNVLIVITNYSTCISIRLYGVPLVSWGWLIIVRSQQPADNVGHLFILL